MGLCSIGSSLSFCCQKAETLLTSREGVRVSCSAYLNAVKWGQLLHTVPTGVLPLIEFFEPKLVFVEALLDLPYLIDGVNLINKRVGQYVTVDAAESWRYQGKLISAFVCFAFAVVNAVLIFHTWQLFVLSETLLFGSNMLFAGLWVIMDASDLGHHVNKLQKYEKYAAGCIGEENSYYEHKWTLSLVIAVKKVASLGVITVAVVGQLFGPLPYLSLTILGLGCASVYICTHIYVLIVGKELKDTKAVLFSKN